MPNHDRRNILWAAAALLALPLVLGRDARRLLAAAGSGGSGGSAHPKAPADLRPRIALPSGSVRRHG